CTIASRTETSPLSLHDALPISTNAPADLIDLGYTPRDGEWGATASVDKFFGSNLDEKLKARGIKTVILCGTSFQGVGISNALAADRKSTRLNSSHVAISYAVFC